MAGAEREGQGSGDPPLSYSDLCPAYIPHVFGGWLDPWTYVQPGAWRGDVWPCPGRVVLSLVATLVCTCGCHRGELDHELPGRSAPRTGVHPTEVRR